MRLAGTVAVVTGGGTGIGRATAIALAKAGAKGIVVNYSTSEAEAKQTAAELTALGCEAVAERADVADDSQVRELAERTLDRFGRVDVLVNNAGTTYRVPHRDLDALTDDVWHQIFDVNVLGPFHCVRAFAPALTGSRGAVVNVASIAGLRAGGSSIAYGVSKAGLLQLTRNLALSLAPHVRVNAVAPGMVDTRWQPDEDKVAAEGRTTPLGRVCDPDDVAQAVLGVLMMDLVTGEAVIVDGGKHVRY